MTFLERDVASSRVESAPASPLPSNAALRSRLRGRSGLLLRLAGAALPLASFRRFALGLLMLAVAWSDFIASAY